MALCYAHPVVAMHDVDFCPQRRSLLRLAGYSLLSLALPLQAADVVSVVRSAMTKVGDETTSLVAPDKHGFLLLPGYRSRLIAQSGRTVVATSSYIWHGSPDGGAVLAMADGGWIYVSNSELNRKAGGVGAIRFAADGSITQAYSILTGTSRNCAGNMTPWSTYLSCEEVARGLVWECDPLGVQTAQARPALGRFIHESLVVEPRSGQIYLTEDHPEGRLYRFTAQQRDNKGHPDLSQGRLEVAQIVRQGKGFGLVWHRVSDPLAQRRPTRFQARLSTPFRGGEGICYIDGKICFATKGDNRIWMIDVKEQVITVLYDDDFHSPPLLRGVDNVIATPAGQLLVSEDGDDMQLVTLSLTGQIQLFLQLQGHRHSELTGLAFSPDGSRLYVSSQRGQRGQASAGMVFEISRIAAEKMGS